MRKRVKEYCVFVTACEVLRNGRPAAGAKPMRKRVSMGHRKLLLVTKASTDRRWHSAAVVCLLALVSLSCSSGPARVNQPRIDPSAAGRDAMEMYDANGDGVVAGSEECEDGNAVAKDGCFACKVEDGFV